MITLKGNKKGGYWLVFKKWVGVESASLPLTYYELKAIFLLLNKHFKSLKKK